MRVINFGTSATVRLIEGVRLIRCPLNTGFTVILFQMEEDISPTSLNVTEESSSRFKLVVNAYKCFVELASPQTSFGVRLSECVTNQPQGTSAGRLLLSPINTMKVIRLRNV